MINRLENSRHVWVKKFLVVICLTGNFLCIYGLILHIE